MGRTRWFITVALGCQLLLAGGLLTSELRAQAARPPERATIRARTQEKIGHIYHLRGDSEIDYRNLILRSDDADYNDDTGDVVVRGHVKLDGGPYDEHIEATHGTYNVQTETGKFYDVVGTTGYRFKGRHITLTSSAPFAFTGKEVDKVAEDRYVIHHGTVTSCELPHPKWTFSGRRIVVKVGDKAYLYNSTFDVKRVPIFYFPYTWHPVEKLPRESGFMLPSFGTSNKKGFMLGDSFYWAINRSMDATLGAELWSHRGWAQHGEFRASPNEATYIQATYFGVLDRGGPNKLDATGQNIVVTATDDQLPWHTRGVLSAEYLSSYLFRAAWAETFLQAINSEVISNAFLSKNENGFSFNLLASRYQNFESAQPGDYVRIQHLPSFESSSIDRSIGDSRWFWSYDVAADALSRSEPGFHTSGTTARFDLQPSLSYAWLSRGWTLRPELDPRETFYTQQRVPGPGIGSSIEDAVNRRALGAKFELLPPPLQRVFRKPILRRRFKHTIEPHVIYEYVQGVDNFPKIIRFDDRDILSDTSDVEMGLVQRLYSKNLLAHCKSEKVSAEQLAAEHHAPLKDCPEETPHEIITWEVADKAFFRRDFGGALVPGQRNVFTATDDFTGIAFLTDPRRFSPVISRLRINPTYTVSLNWDLDYDSKKGRISNSSSSVYYTFGNWNFNGGHTFLVTPGEIAATNPLPAQSVFNQYRLGLAYGNGTKRGLTAAGTVGFDVHNNFLQYTTIQSTYNWDCCGFTTEFRRLALGPLRNENQLRFAFTLANVGTFGNLKRVERIY
jgi:LPS-assembly protein